VARADVGRVAEARVAHGVAGSREAEGGWDRLGGALAGAAEFLAHEIGDWLRYFHKRA